MFESPVVLVQKGNIGALGATSSYLPPHGLKKGGFAGYGDEYGDEYDDEDANEPSKQYIMVN